jgi:hypothetical protein
MFVTLMHRVAKIHNGARDVVTILVKVDIWSTATVTFSIFTNHHQRLMSLDTNTLQLLRSLSHSYIHYFP